MKRFIKILSCGIFSASALAMAQTQPASGTKPADTSKPQQTQPAPGGIQPMQDIPGNAPAAPAHKSPPQAKTQEEYAAYNAVSAQQDLAQAETAADEFAKKYPQSELRGLLYGQLMQKYYSQNNAAKTIDLGRKALALDAENPFTAAMVATALAETTRETDLDRDEKYVEALKYAQSAVKNIDNLLYPPTLTPQQVTDTKNDILGLAHSSMGFIEMSRKNYASSEQHFKAALATNPTDPDATNYLRLAVVQDNLQKYPEAIVSANKSIELAQAQNNASVLNMAKSEKDRLSKLSGTAKPAAPATPAVPPAQSTPPKK
ncbi:MAG: Tetratricopeptide region [Acidobacteriales bacterium]|nr:Tetratricopeptide region [Terriglobales bacterium]